MPALPGISAAAAAASARSFAPESIALFAAMSVKPNHARSLLIDATIRLLIAAGVWSKLDLLYLLAAHDAQAARLNWKSPPNFAAAVSGSPVFTVDGGYDGNGAGRLDTGFNTSSDGTLSQNNAHIGVYTVENVVEDISDTGNANLRINPRAIGDISGGICMASGQDTAATPGASSLGHFCYARGASGSFTMYKNGSSFAAPSRTSAAPSNQTVLICARNGSASNNSRRIGAMHLGPNLNGTEVSNIYAILNMYLSAVGAI